jgi:hypothetical protein
MHNNIAPTHSISDDNLTLKLHKVRGKANALVAKVVCEYKKKIKTDSYRAWVNRRLGN